MSPPTFAGSCPVRADARLTWRPPLHQAQWAAMRTDLFHPRFCNELAELHARVPEHPLADTFATLDIELGPRWRDALELDPEPVGSGCVAQVYRGRLGGRSDDEGAQEGRLAAR